MHEKQLMDVHIVCTHIHTQAKTRLVNEPKYRALVLREASRIWEKMVDLGNKIVKMTDDGEEGERN